jgi:poly(A) polymerase
LRARPSAQAQAEGLRRRHQRDAQRHQALFRNCRIIGRRFRLAHIFFGPKIIETSTFRANPRELEDEEGGEAGETETGDLLIRRDNVSARPSRTPVAATSRSTACSTTSRAPRSSTTSTDCPDLEARVVRTIGDPDIRFREDPVRILRAVKFAARCDLTIEPETYRRMMEHRQEIAKCAQARVSEEFYRLLRAGRGEAVDGAAAGDRAARHHGARDRARPQGRARN